MLRYKTYIKHKIYRNIYIEVNCHCMCNCMVEWSLSPWCQPQIHVWSMIHPLLHCYSISWPIKSIYISPLWPKGKILNFHWPWIITQGHWAFFSVLNLNHVQTEYIFQSVTVAKLAFFYEIQWNRYMLYPYALMYRYQNVKKIKFVKLYITELTDYVKKVSTLSTWTICEQVHCSYLTLLSNIIFKIKPVQFYICI